jgi:hypothetical protein
MPLLRYHKEVWLASTRKSDGRPEDAISIPDLRAVFVQAQQEAEKGHQCGPPPTPIHAAIRSAKKAGWEFRHPFLVYDPHTREEMNLFDGSPAMLGNIFLDARRRRHTREFTQALAARNAQLVGWDAFENTGPAFDLARQLLWSKSPKWRTTTREKRSDSWHNDGNHTHGHPVGQERCHSRACVHTMWAPF